MNRFYFLTGLVLASLSSAASANGINVLKRDSVKVTGGYKDVFTTEKAAPNLMKDTLTGLLRDKRTMIERLVKDELEKPNLLPGGIRLEGVTFYLGQPSFRFISASAFEATIRGNHLYARAKMPAEIGPAIQVTFDLRLVGQLAMPTSKDPRFRVTSAVLSVPYARAVPRNVLGGVVTTGAAVLNLFNKAATGRDFLRRAAERHLTLNVTESFNAWLGYVNVPLVKLRDAGYQNFATSLDRTGVLVVHASRPALLATRPVGRK